MEEEKLNEVETAEETADAEENIKEPAESVEAAQEDDKSAKTIK